MNSIIQSIIFNNEFWDYDDAIFWLNKHDHKYDKVDFTNHYIRFRQHNPIQLVNLGYDHIFTKTLPDKIEMIIYYKGNPPSPANLFLNQSS